MDRRTTENGKKVRDGRPDAAYSKFMSLPADTIRLNWTKMDTARQTSGLTNAEMCHYNVSKRVTDWYERLLELVDDHGNRRSASFPATDAAAVVGLLFDRQSDKPIYTGTAVNPRLMSPIKCRVLAACRRQAWDEKRKESGGGGGGVSAALKPRAADCEDGAKTAQRVEVLTFKTVWEDVVHLRSTREFCMFLRDRPHMERPEFLVEMGLFADDDEYKTVIESWKVMQLGQSEI